MATKGGLTPPIVDDVKQQLFNQEVANKYNALVDQIRNMPEGSTTAEIIAYLRNIKG